MNQEDIIRMARNEYGIYAFTAESLAEFSTIIAAAERNKLAAWMMRQGYATGHGDTIEDLLKELDWQIEERTRNERKACAKICADIAMHREMDSYGMLVAHSCANEILARGQA